jgi:predicted DNA-binding protein with PD1-like motif
MKYTEAKTGRTFVIRLEHGDIVHEEIEQFARQQGITAGYLTLVGGVDKDSKLVVGPEQGRRPPIKPMQLQLYETHEATGTGTLFPDKEGHPVLHMHIACGRGRKSVTGCIRRGVKTWHVLEIVLVELTHCQAKRLKDETTGFELLEPGA